MERSRGEEGEGGEGRRGEEVRIFVEFSIFIFLFISSSFRPGKKTLNTGKSATHDKAGNAEVLQREEEEEEAREKEGEAAK